MPGIGAVACQKSSLATFLSFSLAALHRGYAFVRPFARARKEFLRNSCDHLRKLNRRGFQPLVSVDSFGSLDSATGSAHLTHRTNASYEVF